MTVVILEDAAEDLESGAQFYESCATGVGDYFFDSLLSDLDSLVLFAGVHPIYFGFHRMLSKRFPFGIYYEVEDDVVYVNALAAWQNTKQSRQTHHSPPFAPNLANLAVL